MSVSKINRPQGFEIEGPPLLTQHEAAAALRISLRTIQRMIRQKQIPSTRIGGRCYVFRDRLALLVSQGGIPL